MPGRGCCLQASPEDSEILYGLLSSWGSRSPVSLAATARAGRGSKHDNASRCVAWCRLELDRRSGGFLCSRAPLALPLPARSCATKSGEMKTLRQCCSCFGWLSSGAVLLRTIQPWPWHAASSRCRSHWGPRETASAQSSRHTESFAARWEQLLLSRSAIWPRLLRIILIRFGLSQCAAFALAFN